MRKFYLLLAAAAMSTAIAAQVPDDVMKLDPADGSVVTSLQDIDFTYSYSVITGMLEAQPAADSITVTRDGQKVDAPYKLKADGYWVTLTFEPSLTAPGKYEITIPEGALKDVPDDWNDGGSGHLSQKVVLNYTIEGGGKEAAYLFATPATGSQLETLDAVTLNFSVPDGQELRCNGTQNFSILRLNGELKDETYYNNVKSYEIKDTSCVLTLASPLLDPGHYVIDVYDYAFSIGNDNGTKKLPGFKLDYDITGTAKYINAASVTKIEQPLDSLLPDTTAIFTFMVKNLGENDISSLGYRLWFREKGAEQWTLYEQRTVVETAETVQPGQEQQFEARFRTPALVGDYEGKLWVNHVNGATIDNANEEATATAEFGFTVVKVEEVGIAGVEARNLPDAYYDLQGREVRNPSHGVYIVKKDGKTTKVIR